jgi:hypothetical protein
MFILNIISKTVILPCGEKVHWFQKRRKATCSYVISYNIDVSNNLSPKCSSTKVSFAEKYWIPFKLTFHPHSQPIFSVVPVDHRKQESFESSAGQKNK